MLNVKTASTKKLATLAASALMTATVIATSMSTEAYAGKRERWIAGGVAAGILGTAIIGSEIRRSRERRYYRASRWERHVARCYRAYRSYDERTDTWIDRHGRERICYK